MTGKSITVLGLAIALIAASFMLFRNNCHCSAGPDGSGYMNEARVLAGGGAPIPLPQTVIPVERFIPLGFTRWGDRPAMVPSYPPGLPALTLLFAAIGGWGYAAYLVVPVTAIGSLVFMVALARELGASAVLAVAGAAILGLTPFFIFHSLIVMSDVPATFFVLLAFWFARRAQRCSRWAAAAGLAFAIAIAIRPTNLLLAIAIGFALQWSPRRLLFSALAAAPVGAGLMALNAAWYGSPLRTGYGSFANVLTAGLPCGAFHVKALTTTLTLVVAGVLVVFDGSVPRDIRAMLGMWFAPLTLFYSMYDFCSNWTFARFLLPAVPALIIGFLFLLSHLRDSLDHRGKRLAARLVTAAALLVVLYVDGRASSKLRVFRADDQDARYPRLVEWARRQMPERSRLLAGVTSGAWFYYTHSLAVRWDSVGREEFERLRRAPEFRGLAWYALISDEEFADPPFRQRYAGHWTTVGRMDDVTLWRLDS